MRGFTRLLATLIIVLMAADAQARETFAITYLMRDRPTPRHSLPPHALPLSDGGSCAISIRDPAGNRRVGISDQIVAFWGGIP
jgi:hypothetical protein